jgi:hypothetical protein
MASLLWEEGVSPNSIKNLADIAFDQLQMCGFWFASPHGDALSLTSSKVTPSSSRMACSPVKDCHRRTETSTYAGLSSIAWHIPRGHRIDKKFIYRMLSSRAYIGEAVHKGDSYPGEHDARRRIPLP